MTHIIALFGPTAFILTMFLVLNFSLLLLHNKYIGRPFKLFYRFIIRKITKQPKQKRVEYNGPELEEWKEKRMLRIAGRYLSCNLVLGIVIISYPLLQQHPVLFSFVPVIAIALHVLGRVRELIYLGIEEHFSAPKKKSNKSDVEKRNVMLAQAVIELEKENLTLKKANKNVKRNQVGSNSKGNQNSIR